MKEITREQAVAARTLLTANCSDLRLLRFPIIQRLHHFLEVWSGGTKRQLVDECKNIVRKAESKEEKEAVLQYFLLPETRKDAKGVCLLPWWEEVTREVDVTLDTLWIANRLQEIQEKRSHFQGCGKDYRLNPEAREVTLKVLRQEEEQEVATKAVLEVLEDQRYERTLAIMEWMTLRLKCFEPAKLEKLRQALIQQKQRGYVAWVLEAFQFALLPEEQEEVPLLWQREECA